MNKDECRKEIVALINKIKETTDNLLNKTDISDIESVDFLNSTNELYQKTILFNYLNGLPEEVEENTPIVIEEKEIVIDTPAEIIIETISESEIIEEKQEETSPSEKITTVVDLFGGEVPVVPEKPKSEKKAEKESNSKIQKPPIRDIKAAIGINDKFQFANELFHENMPEYTIAINQLNESENLDSAILYFNSLQQLYNWDLENETVQRLLDLVNRRFS